jgi:hemolysin activation/secretion protein
MMHKILIINFLVLFGAFCDEQKVIFENSSKTSEDFKSFSEEEMLFNNNENIVLDDKCNEKKIIENDKNEAPKENKNLFQESKKSEVNKNESEVKQTNVGKTKLNQTNQHKHHKHQIKSDNNKLKSSNGFQKKKEIKTENIQKNASSQTKIINQSNPNKRSACKTQKTNKVQPTKLNQTNQHKHQIKSDNNKLKSPNAFQKKKEIKTESIQKNASSQTKIINQANPNKKSPCKIQKINKAQSTKNVQTQSADKKSEDIEKVKNLNKKTTNQTKKAIHKDESKIDYKKINVKNPIKTIYLLDKDVEITDFSKNDIQISIKQRCFNFKNLIFKLREFLGKEISEENISCIKKIILDYYVEQGNPFVRVITPEQKIQNGTIKFVCQESILDEIDIIGNKHFKRSIYKKYLSLKKGFPINVEKLRKELFCLNKNYFRNANFIFKKGSKENTTSVDLVTMDRWPYRFYAGIDNTGIRATGSNRYFTGINFGNLFGLDHIASYQYTQSANVHKFHSHTVNYIMPVFYKHFINFILGFSKISPKETIENVKNDGKSGQASVRYEIPLTPIKKYEHEFYLGFDYKYSNINLFFRKNPMLANRVNLTQFETRYEGKYIDENFTIPFSLEFFLSPGKMISHQKKSEFRELRYKGSNQYFYSILHFSPYFKLKYDLTFWINFLSQFSSHNLISSEQFGIGGYNSVRGYPERAYNKDNGILCNFELRTKSYQFIIKAPINVQLLGFLDMAVAWDTHATPKIQNSRFIASIGPGLRFNIRNNLVSRLDLGFRLKEIHHKYHYGKIHFSVIASY